MNCLETLQKDGVSDQYVDVWWSNKKRKTEFTDVSIEVLKSCYVLPLVFFIYLFILVSAQITILYLVIIIQVCFLFYALILAHII